MKYVYKSFIDELKSDFNAIIDLERKLCKGIKIEENLEDLKDEFKEKLNSLKSNKEKNKNISKLKKSKILDIVKENIRETIYGLTADDIYINDSNDVCKINKYLFNTGLVVKNYIVEFYLSKKLAITIIDRMSLNKDSNEREIDEEVLDGCFELLRNIKGSIINNLEYEYKRELKHNIIENPLSYSLYNESVSDEYIYNIKYLNELFENGLMIRIKKIGE